MSITFSGWETVKDRKKLVVNEEPKRGHCYTMYHGTHLQNAKTIISQGFQQSKDGLLGPGVYVSRNIDKAKCYPLMEDKKNKVVFKLQVCVGKVKKIDCDNHPMQKTWHQNGYDSAWVPPNSNISSIRSGREEDCVWDPSRISIVDVACCVDPTTRKELRRLIQENNRSGEECDLCHKKSDCDPHPVQSCWQCGKTICAFQQKHRCKH